MVLLPINSFAEEIGPILEPEKDPLPVLKLASTPMVSIPANSEQEIELLIKNVSSFYAYDILVQVKPVGDNLPYTIEFLNNSNIKYNLQGGTSMKLKMKIKVDKSASTGSYPIELNYAYNAKDKDSFTGTDTFTIRIDNTSKSPVVVLDEFRSSMSNVIAGNNVIITAKLKNLGNIDTRDVKIDISEGLAADGLGLLDGSANVYFQVFDSGFENSIKFNVTTHKDMKTGSYPITFKLYYKDKEDNEYTKDYNFYVNVIQTDEAEETEEKADLTILNMVSPTGTYEVAKEFRVTFDLKNTSNKTANNIKITANLGEDGAIVPHSADTVQLKNLTPNESKNLIFVFAPTSQSKTRNYSIGFNVEYETGTKDDEGVSEKHMFSQYVGVNVSNPKADEEEEKENEKDEDEKTSVPKIIVSKYESNPIIVEAGKKFDLSMTFKNTHSEKEVKNIKMYLTVEDTTEEKGNVFSPDNGSNTFYIDSIPPKGEISHTFHMFTVPDAKARTYTINVNIEYEDAEANSYEGTELVGINVKQKSKLETSEISVPTEGFVNEPISIYFDIFNTGKVTLSNIKVRIEGDFDTSMSSMFIGSLEQSNSEYYEGGFTPTQPGQFDGKIIISYEDTNGEEMEEVRDFVINVSEAQPVFDDMMPPDGEMPIEEENTSFIKNTFNNIITNHKKKAIAAVIAVIAAIVIFIVIKKRKKKGLDNDV